MPAALTMFEQLARPLSPVDNPSQMPGPVSTVTMGGGELRLWCEQPRLDAHLDATPWLVLPDIPCGGLDPRRMAPLRNTDTPWWTFEPVQAPGFDLHVAQDVDLERLLDDICLLADWLGLKQFHVLAGGFSAVTAMALASRCPQRVASLLLDSVFLPLKPSIEAYIRRLCRVDSAAYEAAFGRTATASNFARRVLVADATYALGACRTWETLERQLNGAGVVRDDLAVLRSRRMLAHLLMHDFFVSPVQWVQDINCVLEHSIAITLVQGLGDGVCPPSAARLLADFIPQASLVELPDVGHAQAGSLPLSALSAAILEHRRPRAKLIRWPVQRTLRAGGGA